MGTKPTTNKKSEPKTIKVMTLVWTVVAIILLAAVSVASFKYGWDARTADQDRVASEASALVQKLKSTN